MLNKLQQLVHFTRQQGELGLSQHQQCGVARYFRGNGEIQCPNLQAVLLQAGAERVAQIEIGDAIQLALTVTLQIKHQPLVAAA